MPGWFKGMEAIICEHRLWPEPGLAAQCRDFHCPPGCTDCCCWQPPFAQPDFEGQRSQLQELIEDQSHICDFYPKYHCELNFIEQYWGAAKFQYRAAARPTTTAGMERIVKESLDAVPVLQIWRWVSLFLCLVCPSVHIMDSDCLCNWYSSQHENISWLILQPTSADVSWRWRRRAIPKWCRKMLCTASIGYWASRNILFMYMYRYLDFFICWIITL